MSLQFLVESTHPVARRKERHENRRLRRLLREISSRGTIREDDGEDMDADGHLDEGFMRACKSIIADESMSADEKAKKIKELLKAHERLVGGDGEDEDYDAEDVADDEADDELEEEEDEDDLRQRPPGGRSFDQGRGEYDDEDEDRDEQGSERQKREFGYSGNAGKGRMKGGFETDRRRKKASFEQLLRRRLERGQPLTESRRRAERSAAARVAAICENRTY